jgi:peptidoglycan hydrolase-like protein with peptidoglycan-binding domain
LRSRIWLGWVINLLCLALVLAPGAIAQTHKSASKPGAKRTAHHPSGKKSKKKSKKRSRKSSWKRRGQRGIQPDRVREIQNALIRENYLNGEPTGVWDQRTKDAMTRYQAANGWQTKVTPDSRALIKLGLGPDRSNLINPETAAGFVPGGGSLPPSPSSGSRNQQ